MWRHLNFRYESAHPVWSCIDPVGADPFFQKPPNLGMIVVPRSQPQLRTVAIRFQVMLVEMMRNDEASTNNSSSYGKKCCGSSSCGSSSSCGDDSDSTSVCPCHDKRCLRNHRAHPDHRHRCGPCEGRRSALFPPPPRTPVVRSRAILSRRVSLTVAQAMTEEARAGLQLSRCQLVDGEPMGAALGRRVVSYVYWADGDPFRGPMPASVAIDWS